MITKYTNKLFHITQVNIKNSRLRTRSTRRTQSFQTIYYQYKGKTRLTRNSRFTQLKHFFERKGRKNSDAVTFSRLKPAISEFTLISKKIWSLIIFEFVKNI